MDKFQLDCDAVSNEEAALNQIASALKTLGEKIESYDIPTDEEFNFITPRSAIAANVLNSAEKAENSAKILTAVVEGHTELQNSLTFDMYVEAKASKEAELLAAAAAEEEREKKDYHSPRAAYEEAGAYYSEDPGSLAEESGLVEDPESTDKIEQTIEYGAELAAPAIGFALSGSDDKKIDERLEPTYDEKTGLAVVDDKYIIRCDDTIGKVGDVVVITTASGAAVSCIIGETYKSEEGQESIIEFFTNNNQEETEQLIEKDDPIVKIDNYGSSDKEKFEDKADTGEKTEEQTETSEEETEEQSEETTEEESEQTETEQSEETSEEAEKGQTEETSEEEAEKEQTTEATSTQEEPQKVTIRPAVTPSLRPAGGEQVITIPDPVDNNNNNNQPAPQTPSPQPSYNWESDTPTVEYNDPMIEVINTSPTSSTSNFRVGNFTGKN